jgi:hypothetical protein
MVRLRVANIIKPFGVSPEGWLSRYCHGSCGKVLKSRKQKVNTEEKWALLLHRSFLDSPRTTPAPVNWYQVTLRAVNRRVSRASVVGAPASHGQRSSAEHRRSREGMELVLSFFLVRFDYLTGSDLYASA